MTVVYKGIHSINFKKVNDSSFKNSWKDFHLIPTKRPSINIPQPNTFIVQIPGTNKRIDITDHIDPKLTFGKCEGEWEFKIAHEEWDNWETAFNTITNYINGDDNIIYLSDEPDYYYSGVLTISNYKPEKDYSTIVVHYELSVEPTVGPNGFYPIKFVVSSGQTYLQNYGITANTSYMDGNILTLDDLYVISIG